MDIKMPTHEEEEEAFIPVKFENLKSCFKNVPFLKINTIMNFHEQKKEALEIIAASKSRDWRKIVDNLLDKNMFGYHGISLQSCKRLFPVVLVKFEWRATFVVSPIYIFQS